MHQRLLGKLFKYVSDYAEENDLGEAFIAPVDVVLSMTDVVQPDLVFIAKDRAKIITKKILWRHPIWWLKSCPNTEAIDQIRKKTLYEKYGVKEYWIVDPEEKMIQLFALENESYELKANPDQSETLVSNLIKDFSLSLEKVFKN